MPSVEYRTTIPRAKSDVWEFVARMDNWAPMMLGYRSHQQESDTDSQWVIQGDLGPMSRAVTVDVHITEWAGPDRVLFSLSGVNEAVEGTGALLMRSVDSENPAKISHPPSNWLRRMLGRFVRWILGERRAPVAPKPAAVRVEDASDASEVTFQLALEAGGPMGPMVNALLETAMPPMAEHLAENIAHTLGAPGNTVDEARRIQA